MKRLLLAALCLVSVGVGAATPDPCTEIRPIFDKLAIFDTPKVLEHIEKQILKDNLDTQTLLAIMKLCGILVERDEEQGVKLLRATAEKGNAKAQATLHDVYMVGIGVAQDEPEAIRWQQLAATNGNSDAQYVLGVRYVAGRGTDKNLVEAKRWLSKSAVQGNASAQAALGAVYFDEMSFTEAFNWLQQADSQGSAHAQYLLGRLYESGLGVPRDSKAAIRLTRTAAERGLREAQEELAMAYLTGGRFSVEKDVDEALKWWRMAADQGSVLSQRVLGNIYRESADNKNESLKWYRMAAIQGDTESQMKLGEILKYSDPTESQKWYLLAAEGGDSMAQYAVARQLAEGPVEMRDGVQAYKWYRRLSRSYYLYAAGGLSVLFKNGFGVKANPELSYVLDIIGRSLDISGFDWALANYPSPEVSSI